jgi:hypothetical protein
LDRAEAILLALKFQHSDCVSGFHPNCSASTVGKAASVNVTEVELVHCRLYQLPGLHIHRLKLWRRSSAFRYFYGSSQVFYFGME